MAPALPPPHNALVYCRGAFNLIARSDTYALWSSVGLTIEELQTLQRRSNPNEMFLPRAQRLVNFYSASTDCACSNGTYSVRDFLAKGGRSAAEIEQLLVKHFAIDDADRMTIDQLADWLDRARELPRRPVKPKSIFA